MTSPKSYGSAFEAHSLKMHMPYLVSLLPLNQREWCLKCNTSIENILVLKVYGYTSDEVSHSAKCHLLCDDFWEPIMCVVLMLINAY
jgi:hypothetical protein